MPRDSLVYSPQRPALASASRTTCNWCEPPYARRGRNFSRRRQSYTRKEASVPAADFASQRPPVQQPLAAGIQAVRELVLSVIAQQLDTNSQTFRRSQRLFTAVDKLNLQIGLLSTQVELLSQKLHNLDILKLFEYLQVNSEKNTNPAKASPIHEAGVIHPNLVNSAPSCPPRDCVCAERLCAEMQAQPSN